VGGARRRRDSLTWSGLTDNYRVLARRFGGTEPSNRVNQTHLVGIDGDDLLGLVSW
jgi:hypothetical protein